MASVQQIQQDIQNELATSNQLLRLISLELRKIKELTKRGGEFETNLIESDTLMKTLASIQHIDLENVPPLMRMNIDVNKSAINQNMSYEQHETFREDSNMDESQ